MYFASVDAVFTNSTISNVVGNSTKADIVLTIVTVQFQNSELQNASEETRTMLGEYVNILIVPYESMLFVKPYMMYYTAFTITQNVWFTVLNITHEEAPNMISQLKYNTTTSPFLSPFATEALSRYRNSSKKLSICSSYLAGDQTLNPYLCINSHTGESTIVYTPSILVFMDVAYYIFQTLATAGIAYYFAFKLRLIRKGKKFIYITDSTYNPPYWQCTFAPFCKTSQLANFRFWESARLLLIHVIISTFTILCQFVPSTWPTSNNIKDAWQDLNERTTFFIWIIVLIFVNTVLFFIKLGIDYMHHRRVKVQMPKTKLYIFIRLAMSVFIGLLCLPILVGYVYIMPTPLRTDFRRPMWYSSAGIFILGVCAYLFLKPTYIDKAIIRKLDSGNDEDDQYYEMSTNLGELTVEEFNEARLARKKKITKFATLITFFMCLVHGFWITTLMANVFTCMFVLNRFLQSTIINCLMNSSAITTYGYIISIFIVLYKFLVDIEAPYVKLKNMIAKERQGFSWERIINFRKWAREYDLTALHKELRMNRDVFYYIPMTWNVFLRISKVMRLRIITARVMVNMGVS